MKRWYILVDNSHPEAMAVVQHLRLTNGVSRINSAHRFYKANQPRVLTFSADYNTAQTIAQWLPEDLRVFLHWQEFGHPHRIKKLQA